jgi:hypothetical protein
MMSLARVVTPALPVLYVGALYLVYSMSLG